MDTRALQVLNRDQLIDLYRIMRLGRTVEERLVVLFRSGHIPGAAFSSIGHEAISAGACYAMNPDDVMCNTHRDTAGILARGLSLEIFFCQWLDRANGITRGRDGNCHWGIPKQGYLGLVSHIGAGPALGVGAALSFKLRRQRRVVYAPFGDGSTSTGYLHEALNLAAVHKLPVLFCCYNNQWAMSTPNSKQFAIDDLTIRAAGYGIPGHRIDGNDVLAVYWHAREALATARAGGGPTFLECVTMRMRGHSEADNAQYVPREMLEAWQQKDPLLRYSELLKTETILDDAGRESIDAEVLAQVDAATDFALNSPPARPEDVLEPGIYATPVGGAANG